MDQQKQQQQAQDNNKQPTEIQYDYIDSTSQRHDLTMQAEQVYYQHDVRMKRHPELQPYVPSDRYTTASTTSTGLINNHRGQSGSRTLNNKNGNSRFATSSLMTNQAGGNLAVSGQPKKYCSMTRLNQLAQPKKRPATNNTANNSNGSNTVNTATTLSSNSSNRSLNSISKSSDKVRQQQQQKHDRWQSDRSTVPQSAPRPQQQQRADRQDQKSQQKQQVKDNKQKHTPLPNRSTVPQSAPRPQQQQRADRPDRTSQQLTQQAKSQPQQQDRRNSEPQHIDQKLVVKSPLTPRSTPSTVVPATTPQSYEWSPQVNAVHSGQPKDKINTSTITTTSVVQLPTPASSLEEELQSAANNESSRLLNTTRDIVHDTSSLADQVAEISVNDCFYQSAASDLLVPDSENTTSDADGINDYNDRNPESLCREFEQDLIAKGIVGSNGGMNETFDNFTSPRATIENSSNHSTSVEESIRRTSAATIVTSDHSQSEKALQDEDEEDDRRIKAERELREKARLEEEERKQREQLVENIMSRFSQGSQVS